MECAVINSNSWLACCISEEKILRGLLIKCCLFSLLGNYQFTTVPIKSFTQLQYYAIWKWIWKMLFLILFLLAITICVYTITLVTLTSSVGQEMGLKFHSSVFRRPVCHSFQIYTQAFQTGNSSSQPGLTHGHLEPDLENKQAAMHQNFIPVNKQPPEKVIGCLTTRHENDQVRPIL